MKSMYVIAYSAVFFAFYFVPSLATIIHVPDDYPTIQEAIYASSDFDTVLVQPGRYFELLNFNGRNIVVGSLFITTGYKDYIWQTTIDGDYSGTVVTFENGEDEYTVLSGFSIVYGSKGGIICRNSSNLQLVDNYIGRNWNLEKEGGGIHIYNSDPLIANTRFSRNYSITSGGGLYALEADIIVRNCIFEENEGFWGGGAFFYKWTPMIRNCQFIENEADDSAGKYFRGCSVVMDSVLIEKN